MVAFAQFHNLRVLPSICRELILCACAGSGSLLSIPGSNPTSSFDRHTIWKVSGMLQCPEVTDH